jgi:hypothetical protein
VELTWSFGDGSSLEFPRQGIRGNYGEATSQDGVKSGCSVWLSSSSVENRANRWCDEGETEVMYPASCVQYRGSISGPINTIYCCHYLPGSVSS